MRGIFLWLVGILWLIRFNPAYAGNIIIIDRCLSDFLVQPRVCGEYVDVKDWYDNLTGSTPRMRGILQGMAGSVVTSRFNPAYAGNMQWTPAASLISKVQPRVCGEYYVPLLCTIRIPGSTPRMRGISLRILLFALFT